MQFGPHTTCMKYCVGCLICNAMTYDPEADPSCFVQLAKDAGHFDDDSFESSPSATSYILDKGCLGEINFLSEWLSKKSLALSYPCFNYNFTILTVNN